MRDLFKMQKISHEHHVLDAYVLQFSDTIYITDMNTRSEQYNLYELPIKGVIKLEVLNQ